MSHIDSQLQPGEQVLMRLNRGRKWYHFLLLVITYFILIPLLFWMLLYFTALVLGSLLPEATALSVCLGLIGFLALVMLMDFIHFVVDEVVLTDRRIFGRAQGGVVFSFHKIDLPLTEVASAQVLGGPL